MTVNGSRKRLRLRMAPVSRRARLLALLAALALAVAASRQALAADVAQEGGDPTGMSASPADITQWITELQSVRDFERLYWILHGAQQQPDGIRAELLQQLDDRVQDIVTVEADQRTASAVAGLNLRPADGGRALAGASSRPPAPPAVDPQAIQRLTAEVESAKLSPNPEERIEQIRVLLDDIASVADPAERERLQQRLHQRAMEALQRQLERERALETPRDEPVVAR